MPHQSDSFALHGGCLLSISAVERETGLPKETLRVWERRYGFPRPLRDAAGVRAYPAVQVERLRALRRAVLAGERPGRLLALSEEELRIRLAGMPAGPTARRSAATLHEGARSARSILALDSCIETLRSEGTAGLRRWLTAGLGRLGLAAFVQDALAPLVHEIGLAWLDGRLAVYEEHIFSEAVQSVLRVALMPLQAHASAAGPCVLLTTLPGEEHGLGLLMAEALLTLESCCCISLGTQTPVEDLRAACIAQRADVVALSFTDALGATRARAGLMQLDAGLPARAAIWAGGRASVLQERWPARIRVIRQLAQLPECVGSWRSARGLAPRTAPDRPALPS